MKQMKIITLGLLCVILVLGSIWLGMEVWERKEQREMVAEHKMVAEREVLAMLEGVAGEIRLVETFGTWKVWEKTDIMTEKKKMFAGSTPVKPLRKMAFPYGDVRGSIVYVCEGDEKGVIIQFNKLNLDRRGIGELTTFVKLNNTIKQITLEYIDNYRGLFFPISYIDYVIQNDTMILEIPWQGEGDVHFKFPLDGASKAIHKVRMLEGCNLEHD